MKARKYALPRATGSASLCFNETAPVKARKWASICPHSSSATCFNETAPVKARKFILTDIDGTILTELQ